tara:strand:- start:184 stop:894 length:711 start_codon:yes stop_codon:yes gene_type:complete
MSISNQRVLAITLARGGSKGIKRKNLSKIGDKALIDYTIGEAKKSKYIDRYIISTDDLEIKNHCLNRNVEVPFLRPDYLSSDKASSVDALQHAVRFCEKEDNSYDIILELMCTNPFKNFNDINNCLEMMMDNNADSVIGVSKVEEHHPARLKKIINGKIYDFCVPEESGRRQDLRPHAYIRNGSIYALKREYLMNQNMRFGGDNSYAYIMPFEKSINIDSKYDLIIAENLILQRGK